MVVLLALLLSIGIAASDYRSQGQSAGSIAPMTNGDVVSMTKAGLSEQVIIAALQENAAPDFDVSPSALISLKNAGVSDRVIEAMQARQRARSVTGIAASEPCRIFITEEEPPSRSYVLVRKEIQVGKKFYGSQDDNLMRELARQADKAGADAIIKYHEWRAPSAWSWAAAKAGGMAVKWTAEGKAGVTGLKGQCWSSKPQEAK